MAIRDQILGWLRGGTGESDGDGHEQVAFVRPYEAPVLQQVLSKNGIRCEIVEGHNLATWEPMAAVLVSSAETTRALDVLRKFRES